jgi:hypothetical protein
MFKTHDRGSEQISHLKEEKGGSVTFGDNASARIVGKGIVSLDNGKTKTHNVLYVEGLKHNILSVSQMCDQGYNLTFHSKGCEIRKAGSGRLVENAKETSSNVYILDEVKGEKCCMGVIYPSHLISKGKHKLRGRNPFPLMSKGEKLQTEEELQTQGKLQTGGVS